MSGEFFSTLIFFYKEFCMELEPNPPRDYKDRLFKAIYGRDSEESKRWRLDLYNALNGTDYTDPDALELNTIENFLFITIRRFASFCYRNFIQLPAHAGWQ